jgi:citrate lyase subunit beta/citryl-CoA lyase
MWGSEDLATTLGATVNWLSDGSFRDVAKHVRSQSLVAAKAYGKLALDSVYVDFKDLNGLRREVDDAAADGFDVKVAIHPSQLPVIRSGYAPSPGQVEWARRVLGEAPQHTGAFSLEGSMVDAPVLRRAERIVQLATQSER